MENIDFFTCSKDLGQWLQEDGYWLQHDYF